MAVQGKSNVALGTGNIAIDAKEGGRHGTGGDNKRLGGKRLEQDYQDNHEDDGFQDLADRIGMLRSFLRWPAPPPSQPV
jgi:hypothetical protein